MDIWDACRRGDLDLLKRCIESGERIDSQGPNRTTPLMYACGYGRENIVRYLIDQDPKCVEAIDNKGWNALAYAMEFGHENVVRFLVGSGKMDINFNGLYGSETALGLASKDGWDHMVRVLIEEGADINATNKYGYTPLMSASMWGKDRVVSLLVESGTTIDVSQGTSSLCNIHAKGTDGYTALMLALRNQHSSIACVLIGQYAKTSDYELFGINLFIPRIERTDADEYAKLVKEIVPVYLSRAVRDSKFGSDMQRDIEEILGGKSEPIMDLDRKLLTKRDIALLTKLLKTLRTIDYTEKNGKEEIFPTYDMEL